VVLFQISQLPLATYCSLKNLAGFVGSYLGPVCKKNTWELSFDAQGTIFFEACDGYAMCRKKIWQRISTPHAAKRQSQLAPVCCSKCTSIICNVDFHFCWCVFFFMIPYKATDTDLIGYKYHSSGIAEPWHILNQCAHESGFLQMELHVSMS